MTHIGTGASVIQGISIGAYSLVAAGSVLVKDVEENSKVKGVPARTF
jgi:UDP-perosamine 4-acetyltransferase